ncbi:hypothetical protein [Verminephrobacter aporrectodeae]|uniref:hypothetical protein n=1 Tax=Verminephrobacter aporrectodeae TaxID=1110389 RepID=UPI000495F511|nr:hypothetical protein [Verminephrobacter aporrectodeae]
MAHVPLDFLVAQGSGVDTAGRSEHDFDRTAGRQCKVRFDQLACGREEEVILQPTVVIKKVAAKPCVPLAQVLDQFAQRLSVRFETPLRQVCDSRQDSWKLNRVHVVFLPLR